MKLAQALDALQQASLVHSDIKPDNILVHLDEEHEELDSIKLVDFGSSFQHSEQMTIPAATQEYLAPEILSYIQQIKENP